ncbi:MAG: sulfatase-like hydrolase/transferase, partial [Terriglobia bacterium]
MDRRKFILTAGASLAASTLDAAPPERNAAEIEAKAHPVGPKPRRPNVVVMICDDLGYGDIGCYGAKISTPNLDRLAANGVRFTQYSTPHPLCSAARAAVMTGRYPTRGGVTGAFSPLSNEGLSLDSTTIANVLHDTGYKTMAIGKWHLGDLKPYLPTNRGFDKFYGVPYSVDMDPLPILRDTETLEPEADRNTLTRQYTQQAVEFIAESKDKPFFLYFAQSYP